MLSHVSIGVRNLAGAAAFYDEIFAPLGYARLWTGAGGLGYGPTGGGEKLNIFEHSDAFPPGPGFHLAFVAPHPAAVDAFHAAAMKAGGTDAGEPGPRPQYGPAYYAAFVLDPDGHKLEAVHQ